MITLFILALLLSHTSLRAAPIDLTTNIDFGAALSPGTDFDPSTVVNCNRRSRWDIVWSCLTTIFACTWVAIHPNIPGMQDTKWKILCRRLKLMLRVVFLPESVVYWAWRQHHGAQEVADSYNNENFRKPMNVVPVMSVAIFPLVGINKIEEPRWEERWTRTHGFFTIMGGFLLCRSDDKPIKTLTPHELFRHARAGAIEWPKISEEEIWDRSKGDYLSKGFVILQTTWFVITCLARAIQRLPITELEIVTLAFAALNGLIYFFWFHKPLDVQCPVHVRFKASYNGRLLEVHSHTIAPDVYLSRIEHPSINKARLRDSIFRAILVAFSHVWMAISRPFKDGGLVTSVIDAAIAWGGAVDLNEDVSTPEESLGLHSTRRIKTLYAPITLSAGNTRAILLAFLLILGSVFGGIHLAAWAFQFPTEIEKWIWRISSLTLLGSPISFMVMFIILFPIYSILNMLDLDISVYVVEKFGLLLASITMVGYLFARILPLVLPIIAFRSLPPEALVDVKWTSFVPHIG